MAGKVGVDDWLARHRSVLREVNYVARTSLDGKVERPRGVIPASSAGKKQAIVERRRPTNVIVSVARPRKPLGEITGNGVTR